MTTDLNGVDTIN